jgi:hypothetical protein
VKKVLVVTPRFPPTVAPDYHRIRTMLPFLGDLGWEPILLCVDSKYVGGPVEPELLETIPISTIVVPTHAFSHRLARKIGIGALWIRTGRSLRIAGEKILREKEIDLVFFSTTEFPFISLGPRWKKKFGVPFVVDLQDPWVNRYYHTTRSKPPGGWLKHSLHQALASWQERRAIGAASHVVAVSQAYVDRLRRVYPSLSSAEFSVIPIGASETDFVVALQGHKTQTTLPLHEGRLEWVYAGAVNAGMFKAIRAFFNALRRALDEAQIPRNAVHVTFIGTDYAWHRGSVPKVMDLAKECGVADYVTEKPRRIGYLETLRCLRTADALLMFGVDESAYNASKLYSFILARKPLLAVFHRDSPVTRAIRKAKAGTVVHFSDDDNHASDLSRCIFAEWFESKAFAKTPVTDWARVEQHLAKAMTRKIAGLFDRVVAPTPSKH